MSATEGRSAVVAEAVKGAGGEIATAEKLAAGEQLGMFELPTRFAAEDPRHAQQLERTRRPGRPPGAENLATARLREYLLRRGVNPLEAMMRWALHTPESLASELACTSIEAFRELRILWAELAPYFASKVVATDQDGRAVPQIMIAFGGGSGAPGAPGAPPWLYVDAEQNQQVSGAPDPVSHAGVSHGVAK